MARDWGRERPGWMTPEIERMSQRPSGHPAPNVPRQGSLTH